MLRNTLNTFITATLIMLLGVSSSAKAIVPAGNLMGTTSVTWGQETPSEIQTSIQSILVPAPPILSGPDDLPSISGPSLVGDDALQYTITSNANGVDTYTLTLERENDGVDGGAFGFSGEFSGKEAEVTLGATAAMEAADAGEDAIKVPSDGVIDNAVNGITNGDTVFINKNEYTVGVVVVDGNTATIPLTPSLIGPVAFGDRIAEREKFEVSLDTVGTITEGAETGTVTITVTATSKSPGAPAADDEVMLTLLTPVGPSVEKYVRNTTSDDRNPPDTLEWVKQGFAYKYPPEDGTFYFRSQLKIDDTSTIFKPETKVKAKKDDILEYLIVLKAGNQEDQTGITLNETLSPFTAYLPGNAKINNALVNVLQIDDAISFLFQGENWTVTDHEGAPLNITKNTSAHITYQVTVIGGVGPPLGSVPAQIAANESYTGCLIQGEEDRQKWCQPDGTFWADLPASFAAIVSLLPVTEPEVGAEWNHTACWRDIVRNGSIDGEWVVGANSVASAFSSVLQGSMREAATSNMSWHEARAGSGTLGGQDVLVGYCLGCGWAEAPYCR